MINETLMGPKAAAIARVCGECRFNQISTPPADMCPFGKKAKYFIERKRLNGTVRDLKLNQRRQLVPAFCPEKKAVTTMLEA
jgi:hypothetical protein